MKERVDAKINKAKIVKEILKNPLQSQRQIAKKTWLGKTTVQEHSKSINTTKDGRIAWICNKDLDNVNLWQKELQRRLKESPGNEKTGDIVQIMREWTARYTIFKWDVTDSEWGLKEFEHMSTADILKYIKEND